MAKTDWDAYYSSPFRLAGITRAITSFYLRRLIAKHLSRSEPDIIELGGGNSCFFADLVSRFRPSSYSIIDNNKTGLEQFARRAGNLPRVRLVEGDVLRPLSGDAADLVFSVGLIEHFTPEGTMQAIQNHFAMTREGGLVIIGFPTPTFLYRATRKISELLGLWTFPDERPLTFGEVLKVASEFGELLDRKVIWPILLTQGIIAVRKSLTSRLSRT